MKNHRGTRFKIYIFFVLVLLVGVFVGALISGILPAEKCKEIVYPTTKTELRNYGCVFLHSFFGNVKPVVFMWVSGFVGISVYCNMIAVLYKGGIIGVVTGALFKVFGTGNGAAVVACGILPQYFVFVPVLMYVCTATFEFSGSKQKPQRKFVNYVLHLIIALIGCLAAALTDTYVTSLLLRLCMIGE